MHKKQLKNIFHILFLLFSTWVFTRCAQISPLTGGKKDTDAPKVVKCEPENASTNFSSQQIEIQFDEYIVLKDIQNQLIITPQPKETPEIEAKGKKVNITFKETLLPNTTYKISFGNAITDLREGNALNNFEYILSTGNRIDSSKISGKVKEAFTNKALGGILLSLYSLNSSDSVVFKDKPLYITKTNDRGEFQFNYLPHQQFKLIAIKDQNKNMIYDKSEELIGFINSSAKSDSSSYTLRLFKENPSKTYIKKAFSPDYGQAILILNKPYQNITDVQAKNLSCYEINKTQDTITLFYEQAFDTLKTIIKYQSERSDTSYIRIPAKEIYNKILEKGRVKYSITTNLLGNILPYYSPLVLDLNFPIQQEDINSDLFHLIQLKDSTIIQVPFKLVFENNNRRKITINSLFEPESSYHLKIDAKALLNKKESRSNDSISFKFKTNQKEDYSKLSLKLFFPKKEHYIVQLINDKGLVVREVFAEFSLDSSSEKNFVFQNLIPGNYFIKIIEDLNNNKRYDEGDYIKKQQPEVIYYNSNSIKVMADWEVENEWKIN